MKLEKAKLLVHSDPTGSAEDITFMFNPSELDFTRRVNWEYDTGNRGTTLLPKVNFSGVNPYSFTLQNLLFDTYEKKTSVLTEHINNIKKGATAIANAHARPPVYILTWHDAYFHCVITSLNYRLTMFLPDGTPVKAIVNISLEEVDPENLPAGSSVPNNRASDPRLGPGPSNRTNRPQGGSANGQGNGGRAGGTGAKGQRVALGGRRGAGVGKGNATPRKSGGAGGRAAKSPRGAKGRRSTRRSK